MVKAKRKKATQAEKCARMRKAYNTAKRNGNLANFPKQFRKMAYGAKCKGLKSPKKAAANYVKCQNKQKTWSGMKRSGTKRCYRNLKAFKK